MVPIAACVCRVRRSKRRLMSAKEQFSILVVDPMGSRESPECLPAPLPRSAPPSAGIISETAKILFLQIRVIAEKRKPKLIWRATGERISGRTNGSYYMTEFSLRAEAASHIRLLRTKFVSHLPARTGLPTHSVLQRVLPVARPYPSIYPSSYPFIHPFVRPPVQPSAC